MSRRRLFMFIVGVACVFCCWVTSSTVALPVGRAYEMVSPTYKGGFGALSIEAVSPDGDSVAFYSPGAFAGAPSGATKLDYMAHREPNDWTTISEMTPSVLEPEFENRDVSSSLETILNLGKSGPNDEAAFQQGLETEFLLHQATLPNLTDDWTVAGFPLKTLAGKPIVLAYEGASGDFCHLFFSSVGEWEFEPELAALVPEALHATRQVYELDRGCGGVEPSLHLVALNAAHQPLSPSCKVDVGLEDYDSLASPSAYNAISGGGNEVFFTTCIKDDASDYQLFVRLSATTTLEVSKPMAETENCVTVVACKAAELRPSANFAGASEDGSEVFFTTAAALIGEDKDTSNDLYMATIGCPASRPECAMEEKTITGLSLVSRTVATSEPAEVQGVVRVAPDGSHVYFVAHGVLSANVNAEGIAPVKGADNLYVYDRTSARIDFVGDLCSGPERSGESDDLHCPNATATDSLLWFGNGAEAQTGGKSGQFLVFSTFAQLTGDDTDTAKDVYRYDAETGTLDRVSVGQDGYDADGNNSAYNSSIAPGHEGRSVREQYEMDNRAVTEDGSEIVFSTAERLSPDASNGRMNVYLWREGAGGVGEVSLVSSGSADGPDENAIISSDGSNIFFRTVQGLVPQDTDGEPDIYDARVNGGFPLPPAVREECSSDGCQGPLTNPMPLLVPGSVSQAPGENLSAPKKTVSKKRKPSATRKTAKRNKARRSSSGHNHSDGKRGRIKDGRS
jgi:hypothetical protein